MKNFFFCAVFGDEKEIFKWKFSFSIEQRWECSCFFLRIFTFSNLPIVPLMLTTLAKNLKG